MPPCQSKAWFVSKRYGYGAGLPISWQGWLSVVVLAVTIGTAVILLSGADHMIAIGVSIAIFLVVCCLKTEGGWRWRCGDRS